jgi:TolB-like protein
MNILGEMKRRNLYRVSLIYLIATWMLIQIGFIVANNFGAPPWVMLTIALLLILGFPVFLRHAWTHNYTKDGFVRISPEHPAQPMSRESTKKLDIVILALLAAVVGMVSLEKFMPMPPEAKIAARIAAQAPKPGPEPVILENSIAVLPFANMSAEPGQDYFSDGLSEELLNVLAHVEGLNVASRTSSFAFKDDVRSIQEIARTLRVANILEGSVRKVGDRLRITAQLIDASTDVHLWSDNFDRELTDIFQVQAEIANAIVSALTVELGVGLESVSVESSTSNLDAYDLYLQARELFIARENLPTSWELLEQATRLDPGFARAWEALAAVHSVGKSWFPGDGIDHPTLALAAARRALEIDPELSMAYAVIGMQHSQTGEGFPGAIRNLDLAIENNPKNATAWLWRGITQKDMGYIGKALSDFEQCLSIDPGYLNCSQHRAEALLGLGQIEEAVRQFEATFEANFHSIDDIFISYYVQTGQRNLALLLAAVFIRNPAAPVKDWIEAIENPDEDHSARVARFNEWGETFNIDVCDMDAVAIALRQDHCYPMGENTRLMWQPDTAYYRKTPEFKAFVNANFMPYWQEHGFPPQCRPLDEGDFECD